MIQLNTKTLLLMMMPVGPYSTEEQKLCSNTGSFSVPRYIDNSPVDVTGVRSSNSYLTSSWIYRGQNNVRKKLFRYNGTL